MTTKPCAQQCRIAGRQELPESAASCTETAIRAGYEGRARRPKKDLYMIIRARFLRVYLSARNASSDGEIRRMREVVYVGDRARVGSLVKAHMSISLRREVSRYSSRHAMSTPNSRPTAARAREDGTVRKGGRIG